MMKKVFALLMALMMVLSLGAASAAVTPEANTQQIVAGKKTGTVYYKLDGSGPFTTGTLGVDDVAVSLTKEVMETNTENEFNIKLTVQTNQNITTLADTPDAAAVLVLDVSGSMNYCATCGVEKGTGKDECSNTNHKTRLDLAKEAAKTFVTDFGTKTNAISGDKRWLAIVTFSQNAQVITSNNTTWFNAFNSTDRENLIKDKGIIDNLSATGGTNIEGGLMMANNLLRYYHQSGMTLANVDMLYTVLLTDGNPTYYVAEDDEIAVDKMASREPAQIDGTKGGSSITTYNDAADVGVQSTSIKAITSSSQLFTICFGSTSEKDDSGKAISVFASTPFDEVTQTGGGGPGQQGSTTYVISEDQLKTMNPTVTRSTTVGEWLGMLSAPNACANGAMDGSDLADAFEHVSQIIAVGAKAWKVTDTMGPNITSDLTLTDPDYTSGLIEQIVVDEKATDLKDGFVWNVRASSPATSEGVGENDTIFTYTYTYGITLDNLNGYQALTANDANTKATLQYITTKDDGSWDYDHLYPADFTVPQVFGYEAGTLLKVGHDGAALQGATFQAVHDSACACGMTKDETTYEWSATSDAAGQITFTNLPSGHLYTLKETTTPAGYSTLADQKIYVDYGTVKAGSKSGDVITQITNTPEKQGLTITKVLGANSANVTLSDDITFTVKNSAGETVGTVTYAQIKVGNGTISNLTPGTYTVTESGADINGYTLTTKVGADDVTATKTASVVVPVGANGAVEFENTYTRDTGSLTITKTFGQSSEINASNWPADKQLTFTVKDSADNTYTTVTLPEKVNDELVWTKTVTNVPTGTYTVTEGGYLIDKDEGYDVDVSVNGEEGPDSSITVENGKTASVAYENSYTLRDGSLKIIKKLTGDENAWPTEVSFTLKNADGEPASYSNGEPVGTITIGINEANAVVDEENAWKVGLDGLRPGEYTVVENITEPEYYQLTTTANGVEATETTVEVTYDTQSTDYKPVEAVFVNHYVREGTESVELDFTKLVKYSEVAPEETEFTFHLTAEINKPQTFATDPIDDGKVVVVYGGEELVANADGIYTLTLDAGTDGATGKVRIYANADDIGDLYVTLEEVFGNLEDAWTIDDTWYSYENGKLIKHVYDEQEDTFTEVRVQEIVFENQYDKNLADLTITKSIQGIDSTNDAWPQANEYKFVVANSDKVKVAEVYLPTEKGALTVTVPNLVPDTYTVTEEYSETDWPDYYRVVVAETAEVTLAYDDIKTVELVNKYERTDANNLLVMIKKYVKEGAIAAPDKTFNFNVTIGYPKSDVATMALVEPKTVKVKIGTDAEYEGSLEDGLTFPVSIDTYGDNGEEGYSKIIEVYVNGEDLEGVEMTVEEINDGAAYWTYDAENIKTVALKNFAEVKFTNEYQERSYDGLRIPFSKTVVQTGTEEPGTNTFYIEYDAWRGEGIPVDVEVHNDPLNKYGKVEVVKNDMGYNVIAITVNGANTVNGYIEVSGKDSELPEYIYMAELNGLNWELSEEDVKAAGWTYDITAFPYKYEEEDGNLVGWMYGWNVYLGTDENGERYVRISRNDDGDTEKDEVAFVNTYSADKELPPPPQTGDDSNIALWIALMSASALCFVALNKRRSA